MDDYDSMMDDSLMDDSVFDDDGSDFAPDPPPVRLCSLYMDVYSWIITGEGLTYFWPQKSKKAAAPKAPPKKKTQTKPVDDSVFDDDSDFAPDPAPVSLCPLFVDV